MKTVKTFAALSSLAALTWGCKDDSKDKYGQGVFDFNTSTIVSESTPSQLQTQTTLNLANEAVLTQVRDRLYLTEAGNSIPNMIAAFQARIDELNARIADMEVDAVPECITATPTDASIVTPDGQTFALKVQCYDTLETDSFMIWGKDTDGTSYIYERGPVTASVVKVTPQADGNNLFDGYLSSFSQTANEAGTIVHIIANQTEKSVQAVMTAPHELCAVNLFANEDKIHFRGSVSTETANVCPAEGDFVFAATDLSESTGFDATLLMADGYFMKRKAGNKLVSGSVQAFEEYANTSGAGNVSLDYDADPASSETDVNFGPTDASALGGTAFVPR
ncbi:hypothetical protein [Oligoflexus tunisiensis]|uniref:hypothetical protein n=1 Tax=Oligoflexus tunisiensis TaxID=708132 RepID=UPI00114D3A02|nr:hypothetical protein [Oligoflexus tunisiensis]